jgi:hypothetical protein
LEPLNFGDSIGPPEQGKANRPERPGGAAACIDFNAYDGRAAHSTAPARKSGMFGTLGLNRTIDTRRRVRGTPFVS